jgi:lipopolysaccharide transport system ATP-binding protein
MAEPLVVVDGVWKKFRRGERHDSLRDLLPDAVKRLFGRRGPPTKLDQQEFWAIHDVSFSIGRGESVGIIGPNGAGKSTLLKLLTRILWPTQGHCELRGRVGALIEVAAGFHPDLTGRENVFLQGAIMGMRREETARKFDEIVEFSGIAEFIETPVKRYSSGMSARLGFAIAAHLDPDILIVDEVLAVGDAGFQDQCLERMRGLIGTGMPLIFVSHNLPAVLELCTRAIVIDHGGIVFDGSPAEAVAHYRQTSAGGRQRVIPVGADIHLGAVQLLDATGTPETVFRTGQAMTVRVPYHVLAAIDDPNIAVDIHRSDGLYCAGISNRIDRRSFGRLERDGIVDLRLEAISLLPGAYVLSVGIQDASGTRILDLHHRAYPFSVTSECRDLGAVRLDRRWRHWPDGLEENADRLEATGPGTEVGAGARRLEDYTS